MKLSLQPRSEPCSGTAPLRPPIAPHFLITFNGGRGGAAELWELLPQHGSELLVQLGVVKQRSQVAVEGRKAMKKNRDAAPASLRSQSPTKGKTHRSPPP